MPNRLELHRPDPPTKDCTQKAYFVLCRAIDASKSFLAQFVDVRKARNAVGTPTDVEQDFLRAMLVFASSGLDSMTKHLVRDSLRVVIRADKGALANFKAHVRRRLYRDNSLNAELLVEAIVADDPMEILIDGLVVELTSASLQSSEQLFKVASYFDVATNRICANQALLTEVFRVRNEIAHEMDVDFAQPNRSRRPRPQERMIAYANELFSVGSSLLACVNEKVGA